MRACAIQRRPRLWCADVARLSCQEATACRSPHACLSVIARHSFGGRAPCKAARQPIAVSGSPAACAQRAGRSPLSLQRSRAVASQSMRARGKSVGAHFRAASGENAHANRRRRERRYKSPCVVRLSLVTPGLGLATGTPMSFPMISSATLRAAVADLSTARRIAFLRPRVDNTVPAYFRPDQL